MQIAKNIMKGLAFIAMLDIMIVIGGLTQIAAEGRTGHWAPFWRVQAEAIVSLLK